MRFWDSSALVPLLFEESSTRTMISLTMADPLIVVSFITPVELASAVTRRRGDKQAARKMFAELESTWIVIDDYDDILRHARTMAVRHGLRSNDAIQLASAMNAATGNTSELAFVARDEELLAAARAEGFPTLP